jgi:hypothetical protein
MHRIRTAETGTDAQTISTATGLGIGTVKNKLTELKQSGRAEWVSSGRWRRLPSSPSPDLSDGDDDDDEHDGTYTVAETVPLWARG